MARTTGPLFSEQARGDFAGALQFQQHGGRSTVRRKPRVTASNTPVQRGVRAMMAFLNTAWNQPPMTNAWRASWEALAAEHAISPLNAYLKTNLARWTSFLAPLTNTLGQGGALTPFFTTVPTTTGGKGILTITWDLSNRRDAFAIATNAKLGGGFTNARDNTVAIIPLPDLLPGRFVINDLPPGSYTVTNRSYLTNGNKGAIINTVVRVVT